MGESPRNRFPRIGALPIGIVAEALSFAKTAPDSVDLGQRVHALVQLDGEVSDAALTAHCAERLARFKIPRTFERVAEPLRDDAGKVRRFALRQAGLAPS